MSIRGVKREKKTQPTRLVGQRNSGREETAMIDDCIESEIIGAELETRGAS
jgi:hypothetical protein